MKKIKNKRQFAIISVSIILVITFLCCFISRYNSKNIAKSSYDSTNDLFAIYIEQTYGLNDYALTQSIPMEGYTLNTERSGCVKADGSYVDGAIKYDTLTGKISTSLGSSSTCYLYFKKTTQPQVGNLADDITNRDDVWESGLPDDGVRFVGEKANNFICYGTDNKYECLKDKAKYLYRIIGVFSKDGLRYTKLIKYSAITEHMMWNSNYSSSTVNWSNNELNSNLNNNKYLGNSSYFPNEAWKNKLAVWPWHYVTTTTTNTTAENVYKTEMAGPTTDAKVGLMYLSDYYLANGQINQNCYSNSAACKKSWLHLSNNDHRENQKVEWVIPKYNTSSAITILESGAPSSSQLNSLLSVRPNIYLNSNVYFINGDGKIDNPYIIDIYELPTLTATFDEDNKIINLALSKEDFNIKQYCISENIDSKSCNWIDDDLGSRKIPYTEEKVIYIHIKDNQGRVVTSNVIDTRGIIPPIDVDHSNTSQEIIITKEGNYILEAWGAQGQNNGGLGGYVSIKMYLNKNDKLTIQTGGQDGTNGGGTGTYRGGGATTIKLNGTVIVTAAGGGGGTGGTAGGNGNAAGGASVGGDAGGSGTNGGGGGSSPDYSGSRCTSWEDYDCNCTNETYTYQECDPPQCGAPDKNGVAHCLQRCRDKTGTRRVCSTCKRCARRRSYTNTGLPGNGGSNSYTSSAILNANSSGVQAGNGKALITNVK